MKIIISILQDFVQMKWNNPGKNAHGELEEAGKGVSLCFIFILREWKQGLC